MESKRFGRRTRRFLIGLIPLVAVWLWYGPFAVGYVANLRAFTIPPGSNSMAPTIRPGDRFTVDIRGGSPKRGEIWTFSGPGGTTLIKRVIGLPGEEVEVAGGKVLVDGKPLDEPYLVAPMTYAMSSVKLGPDQYFLLGDSRNASLDSHVWGPLTRERLLGRAEHRFWPKGRIGPLN